MIAALVWMQAVSPAPAPTIETPLDVTTVTVEARPKDARGVEETVPSTPGTKDANVVFFEAFGNGLLYTVNYERVVASRSFLYDFDRFVRPGGRRVQDESLFLPLATDGEEVGQIMIYTYYGDTWAGSRPTARKLLPVLDE